MTGSPCYETNGFQFLDGANVTIKNGRIHSEIAKILVQNYSNLTLDNVTLDGAGTDNQYMLSCNYGNTVLKNNTEIICSSVKDCCAMDVYYGMSAKYDSGVSITVQDSSVKIGGHIEFAKAGRVDDEAFRTNAHIYIPTGYELAPPSGFKWVSTTTGMQELKPV